MITLGPGSLFTSVIPNLLVDGIPEAIRSSPAVKAYFVNLMWQPGETTDFSASDHVRAIYRHSEPGLLDYAVVNIRSITSRLKKRYAREAALPVEIDFDKLTKMGLKVMSGNLASLTDQVHEQMAAHLNQLRDSGHVEVQMSLHPPELGQVQLHLSLDDGHLSVRFLVQNDGAKGALDHQLEPLRVRFAEIIENGLIGIQGFGKTGDELLSHIGSIRFH